MPSIALIIALLALIGLAIAAIPLAFVLVSQAGGGTAERLQGSKSFHGIRTGHVWPGFTIEGAKEKAEEEERQAQLISTAALFPPNVSRCSGMGFACFSDPSVVIPTARRCDGVPDCADASDELNCLECQTYFSCPVIMGEQRETRRYCLGMDVLCDGVADCVDGSDETQYCRKQEDSCPDLTYRCGSTPLCIPADVRCDGINDCVEGQDEEACLFCRREALYCKITKRCIPVQSQCNGIRDCPDGSDEKNCDCKSCSGTGVALCSNGECIDRLRVCDGVPDCKDGLDEQNCPGQCEATHGKSLMKKQDLVQCADNQMYSKEEACTGDVRACARSCSECDDKLAFRCDDGMCIKKMKMCDGHSDCSNGEDEHNCPSECDGEGSFKCPANGKCLRGDQKCDGVRDCGDGSDEEECDQCASGAVYCARDRRCFSSRVKCDGTPDCSDASDERNCTCEECNSHMGTYACEGSPTCFKRNTVCAPYTRCPNATNGDKLFCAARAFISNGRSLM